MARYTKKDVDGRCYIEGANGKLESNIKGHTYGEAIERFAELENADVTSRVEVVREIFEEIEECAESWCGDYYISIEKLYELKKKYTEGRNERADKKIV